HRVAGDSGQACNILKRTCTYWFSWRIVMNAHRASRIAFAASADNREMTAVSESLSHPPGRFWPGVSERPGGEPGSGYFVRRKRPRPVQRRRVTVFTGPRTGEDRMCGYGVQ